jgi:superfamily II DNA or RNA helicase
MATPKTDIEQAVGRILRQKHNQPVVVDIIDSHDIFQRQWIKRKKFYKSQNYKIIECSNIQYLTNYNSWTTTFEPKSKEINSCKNERIKNIRNKNDDLLEGKCFIKLKK